MASTDADDHPRGCGAVEIVRGDEHQKSSWNFNDPTVAELSDVNAKTCREQSSGSTDVVANGSLKAYEQQSLSSDIINPVEVNEGKVDEVNVETAEWHESAVEAPLPEQQSSSNDTTNPVTFDGDAVNKTQEEAVTSDGQRQPSLSDDTVNPTTFNGDAGDTDYSCANLPVTIVCSLISLKWW